MEVVEDVCSLLATDFDTSNTFDISVLASTITNTDQLINKIKEQSTENVTLKQKLQSLNESAIQITNVYTMEKEKNGQIERDSQAMHAKCSALEEQLRQLDNKCVNDAAIHQQVVADFERRLDDQSQYLTLCKSFIAQGNILLANNLCTSPLSRQYNNVRDYLQKRGEYVEDPPARPKVEKSRNKIAKTVCTATMTDAAAAATTTVVEQQLPVVSAAASPVKTYADKSIMHMPSTATRGTTTKSFIQTLDFGTNFPEPMSVEQIFKETICHVPDLIPEIDDFKWPTCHAETQTVAVADASTTTTTTAAAEPEKPVTKCIGTITGIKNVRRKINYIRRIKENLLRSPNEMWTIKKEEDSPMGSMSNLAFPMAANQPGSSVVSGGVSSVPGAAAGPASAVVRLPINPQLSELWQILGQTIFSIVGTGRIFDQSSNLHLINENLSQIRSVLNEQGDGDRTESQNSGTLLQSTVNELRDTVLGFKDNGNDGCSDIKTGQCVNADADSFVLEQQQQQPQQQQTDFVRQSVVAAADGLIETDVETFAAKGTELIPDKGEFILFF